MLLIAYTRFFFFVAKFIFYVLLLFEKLIMCYTLLS